VLSQINVSSVRLTCSILLVVSASLSGCWSGSDGEEIPAPSVCLGIGEAGIACAEPGVTEGVACLERIQSEADFAAIAKGGQSTKYFVPVRDEPGLLPPVFQNAECFEMHLEFLRGAFPDRFREMTQPEYMEMIYRRATRTHYAGILQTIEDPSAGPLYGFNVWTDLTDPAEQLEAVEVRALYQRLAEVFGLRPLAYAPQDPLAVAKAQSWLYPDFPIYLGSDEIQAEVYTAGTAYGFVRLYTLAELESALVLGEVNWQQIVVVDRVPFDLETVVAALVTGGRQWELSHVNVRLAGRGTPNLFVRDPLVELAPHDGQLVRLDAMRGGAGASDRYQIAPASLAEAEDWWSEHQPFAGDVPPIDTSERRLLDLIELGASGDPMELVSRYGGKGGNLAVLYTFLAQQHQVLGFGIPFAYFRDFMTENTIVDPGSDPPEELSLRAYVSRLSADPRLKTDVVFRRGRLSGLAAQMRYQSTVDPMLVAELLDRIQAVFGSHQVKVRFRSSSNAEDSLAFSGAGLYSSTSVCAADNTDEDQIGPSLCDPSKSVERTVERGLRKVWASLYSETAWAEREWYQVPHDEVSMAVLVSLAFPQENANGVAFTGTPGQNDDRYLVNVQLGDQSVVSNDPTVVPEKDLLQIEDGEVARVFRLRSSSLAEPGTWVLSDAQLHELGRVMSEIDHAFPIDAGSWGRERVLLDLEFKIDEADVLRVKQIRPFLDICRHVVCMEAPADECLNDQTLLEYASYGQCDALSGECRYEAAERACDHGCVAGACSTP